jgi:prepilin-type processing-associated H-X9-DG protein
MFISSVSKTQYRKPRVGESAIGGGIRLTTLTVKCIYRSTNSGSHSMNINNSRRAFTLMELLAIIAILIVLAVLLHPALNSAREKGRRSACANNLRQIGIALMAYAGDHQNHFPTAGDYNPAGSDVSWDAKLTNGNYAPSFIFACPSDMIVRDPGGCGFPGSVNSPSKLRTYAMACGATSDPQNHFIQGSRLTCQAITDPSATVIVAEQVNATLNAYFGALCSYWIDAPWAGHPPEGVHMRPSNTLAGNYLFCDGHVAWSENPSSNWFPNIPAGYPASNPCP